MKSDRSVSVVLAGYNEGSNIDRAMKETYSALNERFETFELILVDDASRDDTLQRMDAFSKEHSNVRVIRNYVNLNFGTAVLRGLLAAENEYVTFNACDLPLSTRDMVMLIERMDPSTDVLVLERTGYKPTLWRRITSISNTMLLRLIFPRLIQGTPILNYVQIFRKDVIKEIVPLARSPIFVWPELIFRAKLKGFRVDNVKVRCHDVRGRKGAFGHPHDIIWGIYEMLRFKIRISSGNY